MSHGNPVAYKQCLVCRTKKSAFNKTAAGKECASRVSKSALGKARYKKYRESAKGKAVQRKWKKTLAAKESAQRYTGSTKGKERIQSWRASENGRKSRQKTYKKLKSNPGAYLWHKLQCKIRSMLTSGVTSKTVRAYAEFQTSADVYSHFSSLFEDGMTMQNCGHDTASTLKWHIGHRIAKSMYDPSNEEDARHCWSKLNLFPQWGKENMRLKVQLPCDEELLRLRAIWPQSWKNQLPDAECRREFERRAMGR